jgi:SAM-dependent methyltransferase
MRGYGRHWIADPLKHWSRRWEYPFVAGRVAAARPKRILDAGSGVTYLPYFLCAKLPQARVVACDSDGSYAEMFEAVNRVEGHARVTFRRGVLQRLPFDDGAFDAISCVSVLEHTSAYETVAAELARVLSPGGLLAMTFDIGLDRKFPILPETARELLGTLCERFAPADDREHWDQLLDQNAEQRLTTDAVRQSQPDLLPWRYPRLQAVKDFVTGHGWTGGFRSVAVFCLAGTRRA